MIRTVCRLVPSGIVRMSERTSSRGPTETVRPDSSSISLVRESVGLSPWCTPPPGRNHRPCSVMAGEARARRIRPSSSRQTP